MSTQVLAGACLRKLAGGATNFSMGLHVAADRQRRNASGAKRKAVFRHADGRRVVKLHAWSARAPHPCIHMCIPHVYGMCMACLHR